MALRNPLFCSSSLPRHERRQRVSEHGRGADIIAPSQHTSCRLFFPLGHNRTHLKSLEVHAERPRVCLGSVEREVRVRGLGLSHVREPIHGEALVFFASQTRQQQHGYRVAVA